jgi:hypothetical protein
MPQMLADRDPRLCTLPSDAPLSSVFVSHWHFAKPDSSQGDLASCKQDANVGRRKCQLDLSTAKCAAEGRQCWVRQQADEVVAPQMSDS